MSDDQITVIVADNDSDVLVIIPAEETPQVIIAVEEAPTVVIVSEQPPGANGLDAYQMALQATPPFVGTLEQWLASLVGATGTPGVNGSTWHSGSGIPADVTGVNGDYYFRTSTSDVYLKSAGTWGSPIANIKGATGEQGQAGVNGADGAPGADGADGAPGANGADGATGSPGADGRTVLNGSGVPGAGLGVDGDFYIDTAASDIYGPKTTGAWGSGTSLIGPSGANGAPGADGAQGIQGIQGIQGVPGEPGADGTPGADGAPGPNTVSTSTTTNITGILAGDGANVKQAAAGDFPTLNQNTSGSAGSVSGLTITPGASISGSNTGDQTLPVKASGAEILAGTDDAKFGTAKAIKDAGIAPADLLSLLVNAEVSVTGAATATIGKLHVCSGTSANYAVTIPALLTKGLVAFRMSPGLTKFVILTTGADAAAKTGTVSGGTSINAAGTGTVSTSGSSTTLTGSSTAFTTQLRVGDMINAAGVVRRVVAIGNDTSLTMDSAATIASTAFTYTQTGILGSGTQLSTDYAVGNGITIGGVTRTVSYVLSATVIAVDIPFTTAPSGSAHGLTTVTIDGKYNRVMWANEAATLYCDGSNWTKIAGKSIPLRFAYYQSSSVSTFTNGVYSQITFDTNLDSLNDMAVFTSSILTAPRDNDWSINGSVQLTSTAGGNLTRSIIKYYKNGLPYRRTADISLTVPQGGGIIIPTGMVLHVSRHDAISVWGYIATASGTTNVGGYVGASDVTWIEGVEIPLW